MKIQSSAVSMTATHYESSYTYRESVTMEAAASKDSASAILTLSKEASGRNYVESMQTLQWREQEENARRQKENEALSLQRMSDRIRASGENQFDKEEALDIKIKMLKKVLAALRGEKAPDECEEKPKSENGVLDLRSSKYRDFESLVARFNATSAVSLGSLSVDGIGTTGTGTTWQRITATSGFACESEQTTFASRGVVQTADGRNIDFNIEVSMTRAFMSSIDTLSVEEYIKTDPLVINLDTYNGSVSDQKFLFDLDSDGEEESISFAGKGSGFLAIDKNGDGVINDGSELFGTKSGDGFADLASYDEDGNGWIDENDSVFARLKVWTKDEEGRDVLLNLKEADVGAIYLDNADTKFSLKNDENRLNGEIRKTGVYLKESTCAVGTINHIDLAV